MYKAHFIGCDGQSRRLRIYVSGSPSPQEAPLTISKDGVSWEISGDPDPLQPIRYTTGRVGLVVDGGTDFSALFRAAPFTLCVRVEKLIGGKVPHTEFAGYVSPEALTVGWPPRGTVVSLPIVCPLARLSSSRFKVTEGGVLPVSALLHECLYDAFKPLRGYTHVWFPDDLESVDRWSTSGDLFYLQILRGLFYSRGEAPDGRTRITGVSHDEILSSFCTTFGLTVYVHEGAIFFTSPKSRRYTRRILNVSHSGLEFVSGYFPSDDNVSPVPLRPPGAPNPYFTLNHSITRHHAARRVSVEVGHTINDKAVGDFSMSDFDFVALKLQAYNGYSFLTTAVAFFSSENSLEVKTRAYELLPSNEFSEAPLSVIHEVGRLRHRGPWYYDDKGACQVGERQVSLFAGSCPRQIYHHTGPLPFLQMPQRSAYIPLVAFTTCSPSRLPGPSGPYKNVDDYLIGDEVINNIAFRYLDGRRLVAGFSPRRDFLFKDGALCLSFSASAWLFTNKGIPTDSTPAFKAGFRKVEKETSWRFFFALRVGNMYFDGQRWARFADGMTSEQIKASFADIPTFGESPYVVPVSLSDEVSHGFFALESVSPNFLGIRGGLPVEHPEGLYIPLIDEGGKDVSLSGELELCFFVYDTREPWKVPGYESHIRGGDNKVHEIYLSAPSLTFVPYESAWRFDRQSPITDTRTIEADIPNGGGNEVSISLRLHSAHERARGSVGTLLHNGAVLEHVYYKGSETTLEALRLEDLKTEYGRSREYQSITIPADSPVSPLLRVSHDGRIWRVLSIAKDHGAGLQKLLLADDGSH